MLQGTALHPIDAYAEQIVGEALPAGKYHRLACARHLRDRAREGTPGFPYRLRLDLADRFLRFGEELKHYKGEWAGQRIRWQPHQAFRLGSLFGWVHEGTGLRRFRTSYSEVPRKNGKSLEDAAVAVYATFFDGEPGAEGYCAATKRDQAKIVFNDARQLVLRSGLRSRIRVLAVNLHQERTASKLEPLGADEDSTDGLNPHFVSLDELHAFKTRGMIDVMETATGARRQPIIFKITTAGDDLVTPCGDEHRYACDVLDEVVADETYFAFIAHADEDDDPWAEATWRKANPNYGVSVKADDLRAKAVKAQHMSSAENEFKQKHLNIWINATAPWLSLDGWRRGQSDWEDEELAHAPCFVGIDLASKLDLCALALVFPPIGTRTTWRVVPYIWSPEDTLQDRAHRDRAPYDVWEKAGDLLTTPGVRVDHQVIREVLREWRARVDIQRIGFDPWHADQLIDQLVAEDGFAVDQVLEVPQTFAGMSSGCLGLEAAVLAGLVDARGNPVVQWSVANAVVQRDGKDNIYPVKKKSRGRIDPVMAMAIAWNLALRHPLLPVDDGEPDLVVV
jgi:phage terminase large subunit-like protein